MDKSAIRFVIFLVSFILFVNIVGFFLMHRGITWMSNNTEKVSAFFVWLTSGYILPIFVISLMVLIPALTLFFIFVPPLISERRKEARKRRVKTGAEMEKEMRMAAEASQRRREAERKRELRRPKRKKGEEGPNPIIRESGPFGFFR